MSWTVLRRGTGGEASFARSRAKSREIVRLDLTPDLARGAGDLATHEIEHLQVPRQRHPRAGAKRDVIRGHQKIQETPTLYPEQVGLLVEDPVTMQHRVDPILGLRLYPHQAHTIAQPFPLIPHLHGGPPHLPPPWLLRPQLREQIRIGPVGLGHPPGLAPRRHLPAAGQVGLQTGVGQFVAQPSPVERPLQHHRHPRRPRLQLLPQLPPVAMLQPLPPDDLALRVSRGHSAELPVAIHTHLRYRRLSFHGCLLIETLETRTVSIPSGRRQPFMRLHDTAPAGAGKYRPLGMTRCNLPANP